MLDVLGLLAAFVVIFILRSRNVDFGVAITVAALLIGITSGKPLSSIPGVLVETALDPITWNLCAAVGLITVLGYTLKETGLMVEFIESIRNFLPSNVLLAIIPALFGFLSMPGGALLSAPFIEPEANRLGLKPEHKTYYNVWFRHLLYWMNPITSSTIMATTLSGISITEWLRVQSPLFLAMAGIGFFFSRGFIIRGGNGHRTDRKLAWRGVAPILLSVILTLVGLPVWFALISGIILGAYFGKLGLNKAAEMFYKGIRVEIILSAAAMLFLRNMIVNTGSVDSLFESILAMGIPVLAIIIIIPILVGAISGSPAMGVGISFPILLPLLGTPNIHYISAIFIGITCAYTTSPLHLCLALSNSYYKSDLNKVIRYLAPSSLSLYLVGMLYHFVLNMMRVGNGFIS